MDELLDEIALEKKRLKLWLDDDNSETKLFCAWSKFDRQKNFAAGIKRWVNEGDDEWDEIKLIIIKIHRMVRKILKTFRNICGDICQ